MCDFSDLSSITNFANKSKQQEVQFFDNIIFYNILYSIQIYLTYIFTSLTDNACPNDNVTAIPEMHNKVVFNVFEPERN